MESLTLKQRLPVEEAIDNWDDDVDFQGLDDLHFRNVSTTTVGSNPHRRDSISSRMSTRSDRESIGGADEDWQVLIPEDDEKSTADAISSAKTAGIPIPQNVPASALRGGTIKRLGGRRLKKALADDWSEDIEVPKFPEGGLKIKKQDAAQFPDSLRGFSGGDFSTSPTLHNPHTTLSFADQLASATKTRTGAFTLDRFKDDDSDDFFGDVPTIKVAKNRPPQRISNILPRQMQPKKDAEDMETDFELPEDGKPLRLSIRKDEPKTPASAMTEDGDLDWAEGSLGTRFGGTRREMRSNPSSSISAFSPSASSCLTAESEDDALEGLILPDTNFKFGEALKKRIETATKDELGQPSEIDSAKPKEKAKASSQDDFLSGIDLGDGEVFDSRKLTLNRNIKHKSSKPASPTRRPATTLTFTNKLESGPSKIPRYQFHERQRSTLESVSESGPAPQYRRSASRLGGPSPQSSTAIPTPPTPHNKAPSTPSRRGLNSKASQDMLKSPSSTHPSQYLKAKRSMPAITRNQPPASRQPVYQRPPSRGQGLTSRPKTPVDRSGAESSMSNARKPLAPFLPAGTPHAQSHHISAKSSRQFGRPTSSDSNENAPINRPVSRLSQAHRPSSPSKSRHAPESLIREATSRRPITKPTRRRAFGDGNELDNFDDLPTSATSESKFMKQPVGRGAPKSVQNRSKLAMQHSNSSNTSINEQAPSHPPITPLSPIKNESVPRFARDTSASRLAREQRIGSVSATLHGNPSLPTVREASGLSSLGVNRHPHPQITQRHLGSPMPHSKRRSKGPPQKPRLIKPLGDVHNHPKEEKGMQWNAALCRWDGNENVLNPFDVPSTSPSTGARSPSHSASKAAPALIANVGATKGVQMSGGMIFDNKRFCWLKAPPPTRESRSESNPLSPGLSLDEEDDPFADIEDLDDKPKSRTNPQEASNGVDKILGSPLGGRNTASDSQSFEAKDDLEPLVVGEEFDVGPEFIKRLRAEEDRWRTKVAAWVGEGVKRDDDGMEWKWALRKKAMAGREES